MKGSAAWLEPIKPKIKKLHTKTVKKNIFIGFKVLLPLVLDKSVKGKIKKINNAPNIPTTPSSLLGIEKYYNR